MLKPVYTHINTKDEQPSEQIAIAIDHQDTTNTLGSNVSITSPLTHYEERALLLAHIMASQSKPSTRYPSITLLINNLATVVLNELSDSLGVYHPQLFELYQQFPSLSQDLQELLNPNTSLDERLKLANHLLFTIGIEDQRNIIELVKLIVQLNLSVNQLIQNHSDLEAIQILIIQIQSLFHSKIIYNSFDSQVLNIVINAITTIQQLITAVQAFQQLPNNANYTDYFNVLTGIGVIEPIVSYVQQIMAVVIEQYKSATVLYSDLKALYYDSTLSLTEKTNKIISILESNSITKDISKESLATSINYLKLALSIYDKTQHFLEAIKNFEGNQRIFKEINELVLQVKDIATQINYLDMLGEHPHFEALQYGLDQVQLSIGIAKSLEELEPDTSYQQYFSSLVNHPHLEEVIAESAQPLLKLTQTLNHYWLQAKDIAQFKSHPEFNKLQSYFNRYPAEADSNKKLAWLAEGFNQGWVVNLIAPYLPPQITTQLERAYAFQTAIKDFPVQDSFLKQTLWALDKLGTRKLGEITSGVGVDEASLDLLYVLLKAYDSQSGYKSVISKLLETVLSNQRIQQQLIETLFPNQIGQYANLATGLVQETIKLYKQDIFAQSWRGIFNAFFEVVIKQAKQNSLTKDIVDIIENIQTLGTNIWERDWKGSFLVAFNWNS
ncbi:hypothetical protein MTZ49_13405 [Entomomonas sp. E2T0]|uniref:hypothetical protein n=1 Tax=Entomomonas sp. E2T0 TaxID=2930213 RepID=UPI0022284479|nr:hypothetical protein [Entomomonas sp. E2T0]UYZ83581.1 hypothetical protein MTZ49_13405 [Entomomonas sp. E2T0]